MVREITRLVAEKIIELAGHGMRGATLHATAIKECPSSNGLGQSELFRDGGSGSFGLEFRRLSTDVAIVAV